MQGICGIRLLWLLPAACLAACAAPSPKQTIPHPLEPALNAPPTPAPRITNAAWSFKSGEQCIVTASSPIVAFSVTTNNNSMVWTVRGKLVNMKPLQRNLPLSFSGMNVSWTVPARRTAKGQLIASMPLSEYAASRVLLMLRGGALRLGAGSSVPTIMLPGSGQDGTQWFECVRKHLSP